MRISNDPNSTKQKNSPQEEEKMLEQSEEDSASIFQILKGTEEIYTHKVRRGSIKHKQEGMRRHCFNKTKKQRRKKRFMYLRNKMNQC